MDVVSLCALRIASLPWQPRQGAHALTVICKATFDLQSDESPLAATQEVVWDATGPASDMAPFKRRADVFVLGRAYPSIQQTTTGIGVPLVARLGVGSFQKALEVHADRGWIPDGFAPIAPTSPARTALLGRHATSWDHRAWAARPLPEDVDGAFFNAAPIDQQLAELMGDERIVLEHLHPLHARLETRLARVVPWVTVQRPGKRPEDVRLRCDTLIIDTDRRVAMLVWRGVALLAHAAEDGLVALRAEGAEGSAQDDSDATKTITAPVAKSEAAAPVLPFGTSQGGGAPAPTAERPAPARSERGEDDGTATVTLDFASVAAILKAVTPFEQAEIEPKRSAAAPLAEPADTNRREAAASGLAMPFDVPPPALLSIVAKGEAEAAPIAPPVEKPPMLGPLARAERPVEAAPVTELSAPQEATSAAERPPEPEPAESIELTLEQVAAIAAELAEGKQERAKVLDAHGLRERTWRKNERRWADAIEAKSAGGTHSLQSEYDTAYVAKVEGFRGPITVEEYARIAVGLERGQANDALDALRIQRPALMPIVRLWTRKVAKDMKLGDAAIKALRVARRA